ENDRSVGNELRSEGKIAGLFDAPAKRGAYVGKLAFDPREPIGKRSGVPFFVPLRGDGCHRRGMARARFRQLSGFGELLPAVLTDRLEHPVAFRLFTRNDERFIGERSEQLEHLRFSPAANGRSRSQREPAKEYGEA